MPGSTYSTNLKIELMATGENSGTWGDITNTNLGTALEQAIVGYGNPDYASDANLTISITNSNAAQAARALVLNVTSSLSLTATRELVVPTIQKQYIVQNNTTGSQSITVKTSAGTGITVPNGRKAHLYVDGTNVIQMFDFVDINGGAIDGTTIGAASASTGAFTTLNASGATTLDGNVTLGNASGDNVTVTGTITSNLLFTDNTYDIGASGATRPRNLFLAGAATIGGNLSVGGTLTLTGGVNLNGNVTVGDSSADTLTINSTITSNLIFTDNTYDIGASGATRPRNLFLAGNATIGGNQTLTGSLTVDSTTDSSSTTTGSIQTDGGLGVAKKLFVGLDANIYGITVGRGAGAVSTNTAVGASALAANTTGNGATAIGASAIAGVNTSAYATAVGYNALNAVTSGEANAGFGAYSLFKTTSGAYNTGAGVGALQNNITGSNNTAVGYTALVNTTASNNTAVGYQAGYSNTTGSGILAIGYQAGYSNTIGNGNTAIGNGNAFTGAALYSNVSGNNNVAVGSGSLNATTASNNTAVGYEAARLTTSGGSNVALGTQALYSNTTASYNTAVGYQALYSVTDVNSNVAIGYQAGYSFNGDYGYNTLVGLKAGYSLSGSTNGYGNTFIGCNSSSGLGAGYYVTTGAKNTILGGFDGNQGGLDIRTLSNYIVLSDGDGNPRLAYNGSGVGFLAASSTSTCVFVSGVNQNTLGSYYGDDVDDRSFWINYNGYQDGATRYRTFKVADGKNNSVLTVTGSTHVVKLDYGQLEFPATQNASSNANTLDDYEEGTWTPTYYGSTSTGTTTYTTQSGIYTKVGRVVTATFNLLVTNATGTGDIRIGGLPFASDSSAANQTMSAIAADSLTWTGDYLVLYVQNGTSIGRIYRVTAGSGLNDTAIDTACSLYATVTYIASA